MKQRSRSIELYVEGANIDSKLDQSLCRKAFQKFFEAAGIERKPATIPCGGRSRAFDRFKTAVRLSGNAQTRCLLLVDSESDFNASDGKWEHLNTRDNVEKPGGADETHIYFMVQVMETWLLADQSALKKVFGKNFIESHIPQWSVLEGVPKGKIYDALKKSCGGCYEKGNRSFEVLGELNPTVVEAACPSAKVLLDHLRSLDESITFVF